MANPNGSVAVKNTIYSKIYTAADGTVNDLIDACSEVMDAMTLTIGFWQELGYEYKGREICDVIARELERPIAAGKCTQLKKINATIERAQKLRDKFANFTE